MPRFALAALCAAPFAILALVLGIRNRALLADLEAARRTAPPAAIAPESVPREELLEQKKVSAGLAERLARAEAALETTARKSEVPTPPPDPATAKTEEKPGVEDPGLSVGEELSAALGEKLGLDPLQISTVNRILKEEEKRITANLQRFYVETGGTDEPGLYEKSARDVLLSMVGKLAPELEVLDKLSEEDRKRVQAGELTMESVLGPGKVLPGLAKELSSARARTYEDLALVLQPEQLEKFRAETLVEGLFKFPGGVRLDFGRAPRSQGK